MNQRKAKALRGLARARSVDMPKRKLVVFRQRAWTADGKPRYAEGLMNSPKTTRGIYRALKREARA